MDKQTTLKLPIAAQYLAADGKNYVTPKDDDSHTNVGWDTKTATFRSRTFSNGHLLSFHTKQMNLERNGKQTSTYTLGGQTHADVVQWLEKISEENGLTKYVFYLHYALKSGEIRDDFRFVDAKIGSLHAHDDYHTSSLRACTSVLAELGLEPEVPTWPPHFNTGAYVMLPKNDDGVGFGLAMLDHMSTDYYFYCYVYKSHNEAPTSDHPSLSKGEGMEGNWTGAILSTKESGSTHFWHDNFSKFNFNNLSYMNMKCTN